MRHLIMVWLALCLALSSAGVCRTWHVYEDGSGDAATIQAGIDLVSAGDTVLVHPGEYSVNLYLRDFVSLVSSDGPDVTVLKNEYGEGLPILELPCRGGLVRGFRFLGEPGKTGQGVLAFCHSGISNAEVTGNIFENLTAYEGAGLCCYSGSMVVASGNQFLGCTGWNAGGGVAVLDGSWARIEGNVFEDCYSKVGGAVCCSQGGICEIIENVMEANEALEGGGGVYLHECPSGTVEGNLFKGNWSGVSGGGIYMYESTCEMRHNILWSNRARYGGGLAQAPGSALTCRNNTFYLDQASDRAAAADLRGNVPSVFMNCIVSNSVGPAAVDCFGTTLPEVDCNAFYMNTSDYSGCPYGPHDFNACPSFCFADIGEFGLCDESPCLPGNHPSGYDCGLIGALGEACTCGPTRAEPVSWGAIKAMYR
jgi:hypothetical protein